MVSKEYDFLRNKELASGAGAGNTARLFRQSKIHRVMQGDKNRCGRIESRQAGEEGNMIRYWVGGTGLKTGGPAKEWKEASLVGRT